MRRLTTTGLAVGTLLALASAGLAATLQVGPGAAYKTPCDAIAAAQPNDEVDVAPGTYTDSCEINVKGLVLKGVGGQPKIDLSATNHPADYKGIYVIQADNVRIENLELTGANIDASNGLNAAGLRIQAIGAVVHGCYIHDNQDGILSNPPTAGTGTLTVENSELARNGRGDGCNQGGCTHNIYVNEFAKFVFQYNWTHEIANDTPAKGHLLKSRADETDILYNRITGEDGLDSYEIDLPNGGLGIVVGNLIEQGPKTGNPNILDYGEEGLARADKRLFVVSNTFVNDLGNGTFINVASGATLTAFDNLLVGPGTPSSTGPLSVDNISGVDPMLVNAAAYDYHLKAGSIAIGKAVDPGKADQLPLLATFEYVHPLQSTARATAHDVGAFELAKPPASDGGAVTPDGGNLTDGGPTRPLPGSPGGCGCVVGGQNGSTGSGAAIFLLALLLALVMAPTPQQPI